MYMRGFRNFCPRGGGRSEEWFIYLPEGGGFAGGGRSEAYFRWFHYLNLIDFNFPAYEGQPRPPLDPRLVYKYKLLSTKLWMKKKKEIMNSHMIWIRTTLMITFNKNLTLMLFWTMFLHILHGEWEKSLLVAYIHVLLPIISHFLN